MAKTNKLGNEKQIIEYYLKLDHPLKDLTEELRKIILATDQQVGEQIKWNSPCFYYTGEMKPFDPKEYKRDIVVINLHKKDLVVLVFPTGAKVIDATGLLEGKFSDGRKIVNFASLKELKNKEKDLQTIIKEWLKLVDK